MTIWLNQDVLGKMLNEANSIYPLETGGVLLGWRKDGQYVIAEITGPGPRALHGRHMFVPDHKWQVAQIRDAFSQSNGDLDYLGDWHSHPDGVAQMSEADCRTMRRIAKSVPAPLMLIIAGSLVGSWSQACWNGVVSGRVFRRLVISPQSVRVFNATES